MTLSLHCTVEVWCFFFNWHRLNQLKTVIFGAKGVSMVHLYIGLFLS